MDSIKRWRRRLYFLILLGIKRGRVSPELQPTPRHLSSVLNVSHNEDVQQSHTKRGLNKYISKQSRLPHSSEGVGLDDGCGFCGNRGGWGGGGWWWWMSCDQPPRSHWKGQRYNYTHQRKSRDSETEALLCSSAAAQVPRAWPKSSQAVVCIPNSQSLNNH